MNLALELLYFVEPDSVNELAELNIPVKYDFEDCDIDKITFYTIDNIRPTKDERFCMIASGGIEYICTTSYEKVKQQIESVK